LIDHVFGGYIVEGNCAVVFMKEDVSLRYARKQAVSSAASVQAETVIAVNMVKS
jgi:hypothetical protein